jgi:hypothetical protein
MISLCDLVEKSHFKSACSSQKMQDFRVSTGSTFSVISQTRISPVFVNAFVGRCRFSELFHETSCIDTELKIKRQTRLLGMRYRSMLESILNVSSVFKKLPHLSIFRISSHSKTVTDRTEPSPYPPVSREFKRSSELTTSLYSPYPP